MNDKELLELAAKACSYKPDGPFGKGILVIVGDQAIPFSPLTDDGDALRLARRLGLCIEFAYCLDDAPIVSVGQFEAKGQWVARMNFPDAGKETRRAIVEAAASLAKVKP